MDSSIDPDSWPAQIAEMQTYVRTRLRRHDDLISGDELILHFAQRDQIQDISNNRDERQQVRLGELEYLAHHALAELQARGELLPSASAGGAHNSRFTRRLFEVLHGTPRHRRRQPPIVPIPGGLHPSVSLVQSRTLDWIEEPACPRWPNVDSLRVEAARTHRDGLHVAAAVTARVAAEEAIRHALVDRGLPVSARSVAENENALFDSITNRSNRRWRPLDFTATRATITNIRAHGNDVAHNGTVSDQLHHSLVQLSLHSAVQSLHNGTATEDPTR